MRMTETEMRWQVMLAVMSTVTHPNDMENASKCYRLDTKQTAGHFAAWACIVAEMTVLEFNEMEQRIVETELEAWKECEEMLGPKDVDE